MKEGEWKRYTEILKKRTLAAPSILAGDFGRLADSAKRAEEKGADFIHVDVMDGHFVPNITFGPDVVKALRQAVAIPLDVHLMISRPDIYAARFIEAGADIVTVHKESEHDIEKTLSDIQDMGAEPGVVLNPDTDISAVTDVLDKCRMVLVMSVFPGFGGQSFIPDVLKKVEKLKALREKNKWDYWIEIDGGINAETSKLAFSSGVDVIVAGTYVFKNKNIRSAINTLKREKVEKQDA
ncbi:MAG: ribulose-phosphate 3-epimerase [Candidatus Aureabacteria bacterium]|nr:ribulose-phosphate 3-epimerase [Candidatus Auribacterota bacterium]